MKNAFNAQKKQFDQDIKRMEKDLEAAHSAGQQAIADFTTEVQELMSGTRSAPQADASERAWDDLIGGPDMEVEPAGYYAEALALAGRAGRRMSGLEANMIRLQQEANLAASRAPPAPGPPPGLNPEPVRAAPPSMPPPVPPPEVYAAEAHRDPYLTSPSTRAPPGGSPAVTRSRTPRHSSRPRSHPYGQAEIPSDADLEARLWARRAAPDAPAGFMQEHGASGPGNGGALPSAGAGIALRPFGRPLAPEGRNLLAGARIEEDDDEDLAEDWESWLEGTFSVGSVEFHVVSAAFYQEYRGKGITTARCKRHWRPLSLVGRFVSLALGTGSFYPIHCPAGVLLSSSWYVCGVQAAGTDPDPPDELVDGGDARAEPDWEARQAAMRARYEASQSFLGPCVSDEVGAHFVEPERPAPFVDRAALAPFAEEATQAIVAGGWLGVYIFAPNYHTLLGAVRIASSSPEIEVVDSVSSLTHEQWSDWPRRTAPLSCQPTLKSASFMTYPAVIEEYGLRAILVDLTQLDGSRFAISVRAGCDIPALLRAADLELEPREVRVLLAGDPDPWPPDAPLPLAHGDVVFVVPPATTFQPGHTLGEILTSPHDWEDATCLSPPYPTSGFLVHSEGFFWFADHALYPGVSSDDIARRILNADLPVSRLHIANSLRHYDLHGHECRGLMFVSDEAEEVDGDATQGEPIRNVFFDLRPLGFGLQIVQTYRAVWTRQNIFDLLQLQEPAGWDIYIDGGAAGFTEVQVGRNSVLTLSGAPVSPSRAESAESESGHEDDVDLDSDEETQSPPPDESAPPPAAPERDRSRSPPSGASRTLFDGVPMSEAQLDAVLVWHFSILGTAICCRAFVRSVRCCNIVHLVLLATLCQSGLKATAAHIPRDGLVGEDCSAHADLAEVVSAPVCHRFACSDAALPSPVTTFVADATATPQQGVCHVDLPFEAHFLVLQPGFCHKHIVLREPLPARKECVFQRLALAVNGESAPLVGIPTNPQLGRNFASVILVPSWVPGSLRLAIVFDFSQMGGPVYASLAWGPITFRDLVHAARAQGLDDWVVFLDDVPFALDDSFSRRVPMGTVFCFVRRGQSPVWGPTFDEAFSCFHGWDCCPPASALQPHRPSWLLLYEGITRRLEHAGQPDSRLLDLAREHTYRRAAHVSFGCPAIAALASSFLHHGRGVCGLLAAVPRAEDIDPGVRLGAFVFLDARLVDAGVTFRFVAAGCRSIDEIAGPLRIRVPDGCLTVFLRHGTACTATIVRHGDTLQLGFLPLPLVRSPSGLFTLPRFRSHRGADPPDLTVHRDGQVSLTHQEHLQLLFRPFGEGQIPAGAPPELDRQDPEEDVDMAVAPSFIHAMFLVLTPDYSPDVVVVYLRAPCTVEDAFDEIEDVRDADRRRLFSWLTPAQPQPADEYAVVVAVPAWSDAVVLVFDLRQVNGTLFAACGQGDMSREELLVAAGLGAAYFADVFVGISQWALMPEQHAWLWTGTTITIVPPEAHTVVGEALEERLLSPEGWDATAPLPCIPGPAFCLLTDEGISRFPLDRTRQAQVRHDVASFLRYEVGRLTMRGAVPRPQDHCLRGMINSALVVATQAIPRPVQRPSGYRVVVFDLRPILSGVSWEIVRTDFLPFRELLERFGAACPAGFALGVRGGLLEWRNGVAGIRITEAQRLILSFDPERAEDPALPQEDDEQAPHSEDGDVADTDGSDSQGSSSPRSRSPRQRSPRRADSVESASEVDAVSALTVRLCFACPSKPVPSVCSAFGRPARLALVCAYFSVSESKLLIEPGLSADGTDPIEGVRSFALQIGLPWRYVPADDVLRLPGLATEALSVICAVVLTPDFCPEMLRLEISLPVDVQTLLYVMQEVRDIERAQHLPVIVPVIPQPAAHYAIFVALPAWDPQALVVVLDLTRWDGRVFAVQAPSFASRANLLWLAGLSPLCNAEIYAGVDTYPLGVEATTNLFSGECVFFQTPGDAPPTYSLDELLLSDLTWATEHSHTPPMRGDCYCLVTPRGHYLHTPDASRPWDYRREIAARVGETESSVDMQPALPRVRDCMMEGFQCNTILAVLPRRHVGPDVMRSTASLTAVSCYKLGGFLLTTKVLVASYALVGWTEYPSDWAFLAVTLLDTLLDYFGPNLLTPPVRAPGARPQALVLESLVPEQLTPTVPMRRAEVEVFDLDSRQCQLPCGVSDVRALFSGASFADLPAAPRGLPRPERFACWVQAGTVGRSPAPEEMLVLTSDGSFSEEKQVAGWAVTVSLVPTQSLRLPGQFVGSFGGGMDAFRPAVPEGTLLLDPYIAEVAGLVWAGVAASKLPWHGTVLFRADNTSALAGVQGNANMPDHPVCLLARNLHTALQLGGRCSPCYQYVQGHAGDEANELADALAGFASSSTGLRPPFAFDLAFWCAEHSRRSVWLPHLCAALARPMEFPGLCEDVHSWSRGGGVASQPPEFAMAPFLRDVPSRSQAEGVRSVAFRMVTYNALSLLGGVPPEHPAFAGLHGSTGRVSLLARTLEAKDVALAGLQECRTPQATMTCGAYRRLSSGCDASSCFGVELWLHHRSPIDADSAVVLHAEPTCLIVGASFLGTPVRILVGHAPHRVHPEPVRRAWWSQVSNLCRVFAGAVPWIMLLDANARVGSEVTDFVGGWQADEQDLNGELFHGLLSYLSCWLPATFYQYALGDGGTLYQKRNSSIVRSDYIAVPLEWAAGQCCSWVDPEISSGHMCVDHFAAVLSVHLSVAGSRPRKKAVRINSAAIRDPENAAQIASIVKSAPRPAWSVDVSEHAAIVVDYLYCSLSEQFPASQRKLRAAYFSEQTEALHRAVSTLRHRVRAAKLALRLTSLRCAFQAWVSSTTVFADLFQGPWLWRLQSHFGLYCLLLRRFGLQLRRQCRVDRAAHFDQLANELSHVGAQELHQQVRRVLKPKRYRRAGANPLPLLTKTDGTVCQSFDETVDTWRSHFAALEGGEVVSSSDLVADLLWPLLLKTIFQSAEPAGLKGGYRGILVQSGIAKAIHRSARPLAVQHWLPFASDCQLGGRKGCSAYMGHFLSRGMMHYARVRGLSCAVMFLDLASAYYGVIRETVVGSGLSDKPIEAIAESLALTAEDLQLLRHYASEEPALQTQDASELLLELGREMHASTWFVLSKDDQVVHTSRGTRPGGALADIVFNVLFSKVLQRRDPEALRDTVPVLPWDGRRSPYPDLEGSSAGEPQALGDVVYADDLATFVVSPTAIALRPALGRVASATLDVLGPHGLRPNYGPKKTAAIIAVNGKGSRGVRRSLFGDLRAKLPVFLEHAGAVRIDLVAHYKHLGSHLSYDGTMLTEIKYRLALGRAAFKEGRQRLFACRRIPIERRAFLFRTYVLSAVMAGAGTWPWLSVTEWQAFSGGIVNLYRQLLCLKAEGGYEVTTSQILFRCGLPSPASLLALARLRFLSQLARYGPDPAWAVLSWYTPFQKALDSSCRWLLQAVQGFSSLLDPAQHWHTWQDLLVNQPGRWKGLLKRAEAWHQEANAMQALMVCSARNLWTQRPLPATVGGLSDCAHACLLCGLAFRTQQAWGAHAHRAHGYLSPAHQCAKGRRCPACGLTLANLTRLRKHFKTSAICLQISQGYVDAPTFPLEFSEGHVQFPATGGVARATLPATQEVICQPLAEALMRLQDADDVQIFEMVRSHIEPLPVLRRTLEQWVVALPDSHLKSSAQDVLLVLYAEHQCSRISGKVTGSSEPLGAFEPVVRPVPVSFPLLDAPVAWIGGLCPRWVDFWGLGSLAPSPLSWPIHPSGSLSGAAAVCCFVPPPPFPCSRVDAPPPCRLRSLRANRVWLGQVLSSIELLLLRVRAGIPVLLRLPVPFSALRPFSEWLVQQAVALAPTPNCFTLEFA
ncbi:unnamed protein product [Symbiodinium microadriaticum]|nr:unnamed protein product [Symbiodinium microadriaticum]